MNSHNALTETWPPLSQGIAPKSFEQIWTDFDPRTEPLEVEILQ